MEFCTTVFQGNQTIFCLNSGSDSNNNGAEPQIEVLWWDTKWNYHNLTKLLNCEPPMYPQVMTTAQSFGGIRIHLFYIGKDHHIHEILYHRNDKQWRHYDISVECPGSTYVHYEGKWNSLSSTLYKDRMYIFYIGTKTPITDPKPSDNNHPTHIQVLTWRKAWIHQDITEATSSPTNVESMAAINGGAFHVFFKTKGNHSIHELYCTAPTDPQVTHWKYIDLSVRVPHPPMHDHEIIQCYRKNRQDHVVYKTTDNSVATLFWKDGMWRAYDFAARKTSAGKVLGTPCALAFQTSQHIYYRGIDMYASVPSDSHHLYELFLDREGWHHHDVTLLTYGTPIIGNPQTDSISSHLFYVGSGCQLYEVWWSSRRQKWCLENLTLEVADFRTQALLDETTYKFLGLYTEKDPMVLEASFNELSAKVDINARNSYDCTLLMKSAQYNNLTLMKLLLSKNADVNLADKLSAQRAIHYCRCVDAIKLLVNAGSKIDTTDSEGETLLHKLASLGSDNKDNNNNNNADVSVLDAIQYVVSNGININTTDRYGRTALYKAAFCNQETVLNELLVLGANPNIKDCSGNGALHWAAKQGNVNNSKRLVENGANPFEPNKMNESPYDFARVADQINVVEILEQVPRKRPVPRLGQNDWNSFFQNAGIGEPKASQYTSLFQDNDMDMTMLAELTHDLLKDLKIESVGDRIKILKYRDTFQRQTSSSGEINSIKEAIELTDIQIEGEIAEGSFGKVYRGLWQGTTEVAMKTLRISSMADFFQEARILTKLKHPHVVTFFGVFNYTGQYYLVMEFMQDGSLDDFLRKRQGQFHSIQLLELCRQVSAGMLYLQKEKIAHRDLAARNVLINYEGSHFHAKISDFGLSRRLYEQQEYITTNKKFARKWAAPESLKFNKFSSASDVWSFGVTMWEIFEFGKIPFPELDNAEAVKVILAGKRLSRPKNCPVLTYTLMLDCWKEDPKERPDFNTIHHKLASLMEDEKQAAHEIPPEKIVNNTSYLDDSVEITQILQPKKHIVVIPESSLGFSDFEITNSLGKGFFGTVYKATQLSTGKFVALRKISKSNFDGLEQLQQFVNQILLLKKIHHQGLCEILGCCLYNDKTLFVVSEYVPGGSLRQNIQDGKFLKSGTDQNAGTGTDYARIQSIAVGIAGTMKFLHSQGVIHRDLTTQNILLDYNFLPKITDYGLSKFMEENSFMHSTSSSVHSLAFMSPEVFQGMEYSEKTDVFSFGFGNWCVDTDLTLSVLYEMAAGKLAFEGPLHNVAAMIAYKSWRPPLQEEWPKKWKNLIQNCWEQEPSKRPTFAEVEEGLKGYSDYD